MRKKTIEVPDVPNELIDLALVHNFVQISEDPLRISTTHLHPVQIRHLIIELQKRGYNKIGQTTNHSYLELAKSDGPTNVTYSIQSSVITNSIAGILES